tara:strand:+ start:46 stop:915 length:870 start_codon:yes stop_codon:yes gene_type:complete
MAKNVNEEYPGTKSAPSTEELKARAIDAYAGETAKKHDFPTEIIDLPSRGIIYPEDSTLQSGKIELKYMTAKEEDILTTASYIKQGVVLDKLFQALIISNGEGKRVKYSELLIGDKNAIMIAARVLGYGKDYDVEVMGPSGEKQKEKVDLSQLPEKVIDYDKFEKNLNRFSFTLPASKRVIGFKFLCHGDEPNIEQEIKASRKLNRGVDSTLSTRLMYAIQSVDGEEDRMKIRKFVQNELLALDSRALRKHMKEMQPDVDTTLVLIDNQSGEEFEVELPIGTDFFWPGA